MWLMIAVGLVFLCLGLFVGALFRLDKIAKAERRESVRICEKAISEHQFLGVDGFYFQHNEGCRDCIKRLTERDKS